MYSGLEGIGSLVSERLQKKGAKLLILEEEGFPDQSSWDQWLEDHGTEDPISSRIQNACRFKSNGAEYIGSISSQTEKNLLARTIAEIEGRLGQIDGIVHSPGASNAKRIMSIKDAIPETWRAHFKSISYSMVILDQVFKNRKLDFRIMLNSLGSVLGGVGFINISTVSNYVKAYASLQKRLDEQSWSI